MLNPPVSLHCFRAFCLAATVWFTSMPAAPALEQAEMPVKVLVAGGAGLQKLDLAHGVSVGDARLSYSKGAALIEVAPNTAAQIELIPQAGAFDASGFTRMLFDLKNEGTAEVKYALRVENSGATETTKSVDFYGWITPGQAKKGNLLFPQKKSELKKYPELKVFEPMKGLPGGLLFEDRNIDPAQISKIRISIYPSSRDVRLSLGDIAISYPPVPPLLVKNPKAYFPFIDSYGQFMHETWPGKVTSDEDFKAATRQEEADLAAHPGPKERSKFGGWSAGPRLESTGFFRVEKVKGKWWLVDPEGYLFWSNGVTCVGYGGADTALTGKGYFFAGLPGADAPLAQFCAKDGALFMYTQANLYRKYGPDWSEQLRSVTVRRLKSWGLNTMGNWSNPTMTATRTTPYVAAVDFKCDTVTWRKFPDVFSPSFKASLDQAFEAKADAMNDPWCIGFFVQNELKFGPPVRFMEDLSTDPENTPGKIEWVKALKSKFPDIADFNRAAGTRFANWDALLKNREPVKLEGVAEVATAFYEKICTIYFQTCKEARVHFAPHQLYLGSRFLQNVSEVPVRVAARFCDVVSFNVYDFSIAERSVAGLDKPFIIGEFHFGALDRGMFGPGCRWAGDQQDRAGLYKDYVTGGLKNPACVGAHWFQYHSQAFTGRGDGENFQVGLVDITGNPYPELREAMREVGGAMYETRMGGK